MTVKELTHEPGVNSGGITLENMRTRVSQHHSSQVYFHVLGPQVELYDLSCQHRNVDASITLSSQVEIISLKGRELLEEHP